MNKAVLLLSRKTIYDDGSIVQVRVWSVTAPVPPSEHRYKYSLFYGRAGERIVGYDNEKGKGDHKHIRGQQSPVAFESIDQLIDQFFTDVAAFREGSL
ncbi:DUF6516 family protein [Azospirillum sp. TSO35-2]|uniref:toxin-antitoxin system TumE family protein n=1 Tax=Azospirillum sp. TSO35-2 TaxID=716796 RepID=UPI000D61FF1E|nr:DUF6516 family protein [Azospirillum sp. TSO35-2]PWC33274.1 hypothetical protein TSO352_22515 [Azospirillum sp. TSO35-2]